MSTLPAPINTTNLATYLLPGLTGNLVGKALIVIAGSLLLWVSAKISVPFLPIKMTMQVFVVLALALSLGRNLAVASVLLYLAQGASGLPVFMSSPEKGIGIAYMMGPTGGYLIGFVLAAVITGWLADKGWARSPFLAVLAAFIGVVAIYIPGLAYLGSLIGWDKPVLAWGLYPFLIPDLIKVALAGLIVSGTWQLVGRKTD